MNTRSKRASSVGILLGFCILAPVLPDGTIAAGDRQHIAFSYSGIATAANAEGAGSSAGSATAPGVGASTAAATGGSAAGAAAASGVGASTAAGSGASSGTGTASGVAIATAAGVGTGAGVATVTGVIVDASSVSALPRVSRTALESTLPAYTMSGPRYRLAHRLPTYTVERG